MTRADQPTAAAGGGTSATPDITGRIAECWAARARAALQASGGSPVLLLDEEVPLILDELSGLLQPGTPPAGPHAAAPGPAPRSPRIGDGRPEQVLSEFQALRNAIFEVTDARAPLDPPRRNAVLAALDRAERAAVERAVQVLQIREQGALEQMVEGVAVADAAGRMVFFNQAAREMLGRPADPALTREEWAESYGISDPDGAPVSGPEHPLVRALAGETVINQELLVRRPNGSVIMISVNARPMRDESGRLLGATAVLRDVTRERQVQEELVRQRKLADEASRRKTRMLSALSHDIRTPLNSIVLLTQSLRLGLGDVLTPEAAGELAGINACIRTVLDLLRDLLDLARLDGGLVSLEQVRFDAVAAVEEAVAAIVPTAAAKGIPVRIEPLPPESPGAPAPGRLVINADRARFKQVLGNLLSNSAIYTESGRITVRHGVRGNRPVFEVEDTGIGISPEHRELVFEEFYRVGRPHRPMAEGKGLGLAIGRRLAQLLGGELSFAERAGGGGSVFTLILPAEAIVRDPARPAAAPAAPDGRPLVLVVDDQIDSRRTMVRLLSVKGFAVNEAGNGAEAIVKAGEARPDLIIMDLMMPVMDGLEASRVLRADPRLGSVPIVALTGDITHETRRAAKEARIDEFLEKPVDVDALNRILGEQLAARRSAT